jgi:hypothetical protein
METVGRFQKIISPREIKSAQRKVFEDKVEEAGHWLLKRKTIMRNLIIAILVTTCSWTFGGEISDIYFQSLRTNSIDSRLNNRVVNHSGIVSTNYGIAEIGIERTGCFGSCPAYTFIVKSDGNFSYKGEKYAERQGEFTGTIDVWEFNNLAKFINESGYMELKDTYTRLITDSSTTFTMVVMNGEQKVISNYAGSGPAKLWAIEQLIDQLLAKAKWNNSPTAGDIKK